MKHTIIKMLLIALTITPLAGSELISVEEASYSPITFKSIRGTKSIRIFRNVTGGTSLCEILAYRNENELRFLVELHMKGELIQKIEFSRTDIRAPYVFDVMGNKETLGMVKSNGLWLLQSDICDLSMFNQCIIDFEDIVSQKEVASKGLNMELLNENIELKSQVKELRTQLKALKSE